MTSGLTARIRLVRCPRCRLLLPELPNIPVYKCGGCNTVLQAKNRNVELGLQNTDSIPRCELDHPSEDKEPSIASHEATIPPSDESNLDPNNEEDQKESGVCSSKELVRIHSSERKENVRNDDESCARHGGQPGCSNHVCSAMEFSRHGDDELSDTDLPELEEASISSSHEATIPSSGECIIDPKDVNDQKEFRDSSSEQLIHIKSGECQNSARSNDESRVCHGEQPGCSNQFYSTIEFDHHENGGLPGRDPIEAEETSISSHEVITIPSSGECILDPNDEEDQKENEENSNEQLVCIISSEHQKNACNDDETRACHGEQSGFSNQVFYANEFASKENDELSSGVRSEDEIINETLSSREESPEANSMGIDSNFESSGIVNQVATGPSVITADTQVGAGISSKTLASLAEREEEPEETTNSDFEHRSSVDNFGSIEVNRCSEPRGPLLDMAKSPTTKSSLAYDGSVSSFDGMDDQFLDHRTRSLKNIHRAADFLAHGESPRRENSLMNNETRSSRIDLLEEKHYAIEYRKRNEDDLLQHGRRDFSMHSKNGLRRERYQPKASLLGRDCLGGYDKGSSSGSMIDEFHDSRIHSSANFVDHDHDKVRLLRMVYELQDQLERTCNLNGKGSGRVSIGSTEENPWAQMYHNQQIPQEESWDDSGYPRYLERRRLGTNYPRQHFLSRMASAGKVAGGPQIKRSMQLLPSELWHNREFRMAHSNHDCYSYYGSCPSSPQHYLSSQLSARGGRLKSENLRHRNHEINYMRERNHVVKHHLRPTAGGAPFITCYYCLKLLQIPAEFLLLKRRCNRLRCGHCSKVLEFSLQSRTHIVPYTASPAGRPPSETEERSITNRRTMTTSEYYARDGPIEDPASSSGDHGLAIYKSGSREGDHSTLRPHPSRQDMEKELVFKHSQNKFENPEKRDQSGGPSRHVFKAEKFSSEIEKSSTMSNSPLHRLMGYSSPSQVVRGLETSGRSMQKKI